MKRNIEDVHKELLVLAKHFNDFCLNNNVNYSIHGGTMLGAVREKGFIPWDDDIDVTFTRQEYDRFEKALHLEPSDDFILSKSGFNPTLIMKREGRPVVWIDIFIYDYITDNPVLRKYKLTRLKLYSLLFRDPDTLRLTRNNSRGNPIRYALIAIPVMYGRFADKKRLHDRADRFMMSLQGNRKWLCRTNDTVEGIYKLVPGYSMDKYEMIKFEDTELMISSYWDDILTSSYGKDYMTPRKTNIDIIHNDFISRESIKAEKEWNRERTGHERS